jgi:murein DD-endopeptidase MepM/ murein hydrolase activator NlpD
MNRALVFTYMSLLLACSATRNETATRPGAVAERSSPSTAQVALPLAAPLLAPKPPEPHVPRLRNQALFAPIAGGSMSGYAGDTGLDIAAKARTVYAIADGTLEYSENGHTRWTDAKRGDTPGSVRLRLSTPLAWRGHQVTHVYYTHMSKLTFAMAEGDEPATRVHGGQELGTSGSARGMPHLHIGLLLDNHVEQDTWASLLTEDEIRQLFGGYKNGERIPESSPRSM